MCCIIRFLFLQKRHSVRHRCSMTALFSVLFLGQPRMPRHFWVVLLCIFLGQSAVALNISQHYDPAVMYNYLLYAGNAYCDFDDISAWTCPACALANPSFTPISLFYNDSTNIFAYIGLNYLDSKTPEILVSFRGTQFSDLENWILNLNFPEAEPYHDYSDCYVHRGFFNGYWSIREGLELWIGELFSMYPDARLTITGHSLGGALATICATELGIIYQGQKNISLWTIESPRVGNQVCLFISITPLLCIFTIHTLYHY